MSFVHSLLDVMRAAIIGPRPRDAFPLTVSELPPTLLKTFDRFE